MTKSKVSDEQIIEKMMKLKNPSDRQIAIACGVTPNGSFSNRLREIRRNNKIPEPDRTRKGRPPAKDTDILRFEDVRKDDRLMKGKKRLIVLAVKDDELLLQRMDGTSFTISRKTFNATAEYSKVSAGDPQAGPVKAYIDPSLKIGDIKVCGQPIKTMSDGLKEKILNGLKEGEKASSGMSEAIADAYGLPAKDRKPATINPEFEAAVKEMEAQHKSKKDPIKIDLEMESSADPVSLFPQEPQGYIDPEWGFIKQKSEEKHIRDYLSDINQLLDILVGDCAEPEMAEQTKKLICYKLVIGFKREIGQEAGV